ncbi:ABC transporter permease [Pseudonocardia asaccharolytica]|uniref:ABC transporter permease n=1 Tax=Pseudonocardia asaccharolytica DSM 44247 = NBRC 16224 TaxID=1123024 RepID=A0A511D0J4_9PSEU|nr:ABC transporter permease [Pseudonocardia asaccharolytica]GEL18286.1 ABC transporter permease [Pseudonocardia asaccharolytica DSM 44247 = NBRC 16224]
MRGLLRAELRKTASTGSWWALLVPVVLLTVSINAFGGLFGATVTGLGAGSAVVLLASLAYTLGLTSVLAMVHGVVVVTSEFRHRTITTTYLTAPGRDRVLVAKILTAGAIGTGYAAAAVVFGLGVGLAVQGGGALPAPGPLLGVTATGIVVCWLWSVFGVALGMLVTSQVGALVLALVYVLAGENVLALVLNSAEPAVGSTGPPLLARLTAYLPVNAGDIALYDVPARELAGPRLSGVVIEGLAGVTAPPTGWVSLVVLATWVTAAVAAAWLVGARRDIT